MKGKEGTSDKSDPLGEVEELMGKAKDFGKEKERTMEFLDVLKNTELLNSSDQTPKNKDKIIK